MIVHMIIAIKPAWLRNGYSFAHTLTSCHTTTWLRVGLYRYCPLPVWYLSKHILHGEVCYEKPC